MAGVINERLGNVRLDKLTPLHLQSLYSSFRNTPRKALYLHQAIHTALQLAVQWQLLSVNVADRIKRPSYRSKEKQLWTIQQLRQFLEATKEDEWWPLWVSAVQTGCRIGELTALKWKDVDFTQQVVKIERNLQRVDGKCVETTPKTNSGKRLVHLSSLGMEALQKQKRLQAEWQLRSGCNWNNVNGYIFTSKHGTPLDRYNATHALARACGRMGLPIITPHCFRPLNASLALQNGAPLNVVSKHLGHSNVAITASIYAHCLGDTKAVAEAISKALTELAT